MEVKSRLVFKLLLKHELLRLFFILEQAVAYTTVLVSGWFNNSGQQRFKGFFLSLFCKKSSSYINHSYRSLCCVLEVSSLTLQKLNFVAIRVGNEEECRQMFLLVVEGFYVAGFNTQ